MKKMTSSADVIHDAMCGNSTQCVGYRRGEGEPHQNQAENITRELAPVIGEANVILNAIV